MGHACRAEELRKGELRHQIRRPQGGRRLLSAVPFGRGRAARMNKAMFLRSLPGRGLLVYAMALYAWCQGAPGLNCVTRLPASHRIRLRKEAQGRSAAFA